jgi:hypothetical protein
MSVRASELWSLQIFCVKQGHGIIPKRISTKEDAGQADTDCRVESPFGAHLETESAVHWFGEILVVARAQQVAQ